MAADTQLPEYLQNTQDKASRLDALLSGLTVLNNEGTADDARYVIAEMAQELAHEINMALDSAHLPAGAIQ